MIKADLHIHTLFSNDSSIHPKTLVEQLYAHPYIKAAAITDHNTVKGFHKVRDLAAAYSDITIIPGIEVTTVDGDLIILGVAEVPPEPWTVGNVIDFARDAGALVIVPHPYREYGLGDAARNYRFDAVEVLNGGSANQANAMAENLARELGIPGVAGSDAHKLEELWSVYTEIQASASLDDILEAIRKGLVRVARFGKSIYF
ncbi:MAG: PHP domain-containing protein [Candidatus Bathyarchaeota archaeon]|nr:PHP domain-containing protein [Candidatus Bathyarchaeota archaeon]MCX8177053.1 PHP domain-containing protein [Candidatus Bathyarchaeota archaeon]MDW8194208.1 PHP domain-containing protein [Nitrososphaerota archaeon]